MIATKVFISTATATSRGYNRRFQPFYGINDTLISFCAAPGLFLLFLLRRIYLAQHANSANCKLVCAVGTW